MFALSAVSAELRAAARRYQPANMMQAGRDLAHLHEVADDFADAIRILATRAAENWPISPKVIELLAAAYAVQRKVAEALTEVGPAFRSAHAADIARHESPRAGERLWNV